MAEPGKRNGRKSAASDGKASAAPSRSKGTKSNGSKLRKVFGGILIGGVVLALVAVAGVVVAYLRVDIPDPNADFQTNNTEVLYADGESEMGTFQVQNRESIPYEEIPQTMKDAAIAAENRTFWTDPGFSITGMARAAITILTGGDIQGGSTITQQYIKIMYLSPEQTMERKFTELLLAAKLNREVSKEDILAGYLNTIYFGRGAYGVQAAAQAYFEVDAADLDLEQSAALAAILNSPGNNDPAEGEANAERLLDRYRYVLDGMVETGAITAAEAQESRTELPEFPEIEASSRFGGPQGHLLKMVSDELTARGFEESQIQGGGLRVTTTIDKTSQDAMVEAAEAVHAEAAANNPEDPEGADLHAAMASVDSQNGGIRALYGGPDYVESQINWAYTARPTGSTFKVFALAAGLEDGFRLNDYFEGNAYYPAGSDEPVRNQGGATYGSVNLITATAQSINTAFVDLTEAMNPNGPEKVIDAAERAGVPKRDGQDWAPVPNIALGVAEASPVAMAGAYATFANEGVRHDTHIVSQVTDASGRVLYEYEGEGERAFEADVNSDVTYAMSQVVDEGSGRSVQALNRPVAGKTGTNGITRVVDGVEVNDVTSSWFVGTTPQVSTSVMFVAGDGYGDLDPYARPGDSTFFGGTYPAQAWEQYMEVAVADMPVEEFPEPAFVDKEKTDGTAEPRQQPPNSGSSNSGGGGSNDDDSSSERTSAPEPSDSGSDDQSSEPSSRPTGGSGSDDDDESDNGGGSSGNGGDNEGSGGDEESGNGDGGESGDGDDSSGGGGEQEGEDSGSGSGGSGSGSGSGGSSGGSGGGGSSNGSGNNSDSDDDN